ncbi:MAG: LytR/AlgR family response regulator transcription factor [Saprospiraceae bacterium]
MPSGTKQLSNSFLQPLGTFESGLDVESDLLQRADLLFLDIQLPELNGIQYLKSLAQPPQVIVTTAYPNFALDAFKIAATDYLLKPFSFARFYKSIQRIQQQQLASPSQDATYFIYADKTTYKIKTSEILFFKAEVDYVKIVT